MCQVKGTVYFKSATTAESQALLHWRSRQNRELTSPRGEGVRGLEQVGKIRIIV